MERKSKYDPGYVATGRRGYASVRHFAAHEKAILFHVALIALLSGKTPKKGFVDRLLETSAMHCPNDFIVDSLQDDCNE